MRKNGMIPLSVVVGFLASDVWAAAPVGKE